MRRLGARSGLGSFVFAHQPSSSHELQPFRLKRSRTRLSCRWSGHDHQPKASTQLMLVPPHDFAEPTPDTIPHHRTADSSGGDQPDAESRLIFQLQNPEQQQSAAHGPPLRPHPRKLASELQTPRGRKGKTRFIHRAAELSTVVERHFTKFGAALMPQSRERRRSVS